MVHLDEEYKPDKNDDNVVVAVETNTEREEESAPCRLLRKSASKKAKGNSMKQVQFPNNLCSLVAMEKHAFKLLWGPNVSTRVLLTALGMHKDYLVA
jgi:hypothetical protein